MNNPTTVIASTNLALQANHVEKATTSLEISTSPTKNHELELFFTCKIKNNPSNTEKFENTTSIGSLVRRPKIRSTP